MQSRDDLLAYAADEFFAAAASGNEPSVEDFARRFPSIAEDVRNLFPALAMVGDSIPGDELNGRSSDGAAVRELGDFRIIREVGRGGMGIVYEAEQLSIGRRVALKVLPFAGMLNPQQLNRFKNEARAAGTLDHPNIVSVLFVGDDRGVHYFAMQLVEGASLAEVLNTPAGDGDSRLRPSHEGVIEGGDASHQRRIADPTYRKRSDKRAQAFISTLDEHDQRDYFRAVAQLGVQAADALGYAHRNGVVHRDVKPANLLLDGRGKLWVTDFGLAQIESDANLTMSGDMLGTLRYMSPEQAAGRRDLVDKRTDVYSLGVTLYELLARRPMFPVADRNQLLTLIASQEPKALRQINSSIPRELETIVAKAIAKDPPDRYESADELADELTRFLEHRPIVARPPGPMQRVAKWTLRHHRLVGIYAACLVLLSVVLAVSMAFVMRAESRAVAALEETSAILYATDMALAYQTFEKGWSDEVSAILDRYRPREGRKDRRGLEWHLLETLTKEPASTSLVGHSGSVNELAIFPDRGRLASVGDDATLRIWDLHRRRLLRTINLGEDPLFSVAVSPDGRYAAAGSNRVYLCDLASDEAAKVLHEGSHNVESLAFNNDGAQVIAGYRYEEVCVLNREGELVRRIPRDSRVESLQLLPDEAGVLIPARRASETFSAKGVIERWNADLTEVQEIFAAPEGEPSRFTAARISPCGRYILVAERYRRMTRILDRKTGRTLVTTSPSRDRVNDVAYAPNGHAIAVGYQNGRWEYFDLTLNADRTPVSAVRRRVVEAHQQETHCVQFIDREHVATSGSDGLIRIWNLPDQNASAMQLGYQPLVGIDLSPDGELLLCTYTDRFTLVDAAGKQTVAEAYSPQARYSAPRWSPTGKQAAFTCRSEWGIMLINRSGDVLFTIPLTFAATGVSFSKTGSQVAAIGHDRLQVFDVDDRKMLIDRPMPKFGNQAQLAMSNGGSLLACGGESGELLVLDADTFQPVQEIPGRSAVNCLAYSPNDALLASGHNDSVIRLWNASSGEFVGELVGHSRAVYKLAFSRDSRTLLSSSEDGSVRVWSVDQRRAYGVLIKRPSAPSHPGCVLSLSADARRLVVAYRSHTDDEPSALLWELAATPFSRSNR